LRSLPLAPLRPLLCAAMDGLLKKATTADDTPTPGYVYVELAKLTHNDITIIDKMADWLAGA